MILLGWIRGLFSNESGQLDHDDRRILKSALVDQARKRLAELQTIEAQTPDPGQKAEVREKREQTEIELTRLQESNNEHQDLLDALGIR